MERSGADSLVDALVAHGVDLVFGYPGGAIMPVYDALHRARDRIRHVLVRHEQGAVHAAEGYARVSGRVGVCIATSGPGATNLVTGLADALMDSTPVVAITGQVAAPKLGTDAFQEADVIGLTLAATKWSVQLADPADLAGAVARALEIATSGRPGPVLIDVTRDAQSGPVEADAERPAAPRWRYPRRSEDLSGVAEAARRLNAAERPYLLLGQGVLISGAEREALALAERAGMPVATTLLGLGAVPPDHPLSVGLLGMHGNYGANVLTNEADVIVAVGMRFDDRVTGRVDGYAPDAAIVHVDVDPAEVDRLIPVDVPIIADARAALAALLPLVEPRARPTWVARFAAHSAEEHARVTAGELDPAGSELTMAEVVHRLCERTAGDAVIVSDVGQHQMIAARHYRFARPRSHVTSGGLGTMGFALPAAVGAKLAAPEREVIAVIGDGGFQMTLQELGAIVQEDLAVKVVVLDNAHLGMVRQWQELFFDGRYSAVEMRNPDFAAIARGFGVPAERVHERVALDAALERLLAAPGPYLLSIEVARAENVFPMIPLGASVAEVLLGPEEIAP